MTRRLVAVCVVVAALAAATTGQAGAGAAGGSLALVRVTSAPEGKEALSPRYLNTVVATARLTFRVALHNTAARRRLTVTVTVTRPRAHPGALVRAKTVWLGAARSGAVKLGPFAPIMFAVPSRVKVSVEDAKTHEVWTSSYRVIFSLG